MSKIISKKYVAVLLLTAGVLLAVQTDYGASEAYGFHSPEELKQFMVDSITLPIGDNPYFVGSGKCEGCHGFDNNGIASLDSLGNDINVVDDWRATMMANSAKDPFWRAKVSHEVLVNPALQQDIETKCTACHAPMGHFTAKFEGQEHYSIAEMMADSLALDGVSCVTCHQISNEQLGDLNSGNILFNLEEMYGPYFDVFEGPMTEFVGIEPVFAEHILDAGLCAPCHSLLTNTVDLEGNETGDLFVEQATYHEWLNSKYSTEFVSCQSCHMPRLQDSVVISSNYINLEAQYGYGLHELVGANTFMLNLMKDNIEELGITATEENFDATIEATMEMLQQKSIEIDLTPIALYSDTAKFALSILNKAGHKFPSGYPSRRAFVEFVVLDVELDTLFKSGALQSDYEVEGHDAHFEPHHKIITQTDQVQIYEFVLGDVEGNFTTLLERAAIALKDNRLPPIGFSINHEVYDTTQIVGAAYTDANFNWEDETEGSGKDVIYYHIPMNAYEGDISVSAKIYYQALPPKWMAEMFAESTPEIDLFRDMYDQTDQTPVLVKSEYLENLNVASISNIQEHLLAASIKLYPNPSPDGQLTIDIPNSIGLLQIRLLSSDGRLIQSYDTAEGIELPEANGIYLVEIITTEGKFVKKIVR